MRFSVSPRQDCLYILVASRMLKKQGSELPIPINTPRQTLKLVFLLITYGPRVRFTGTSAQISLNNHFLTNSQSEEFL